MLGREFVPLRSGRPWAFSRTFPRTHRSQPWASPVPAWTLRCPDRRPFQESRLAASPGRAILADDGVGGQVYLLIYTGRHQEMWDVPQVFFKPGFHLFMAGQSWTCVTSYCSSRTYLLPGLLVIRAAILPATHHLPQPICMNLGIRFGVLSSVAECIFITTVLFITDIHYVYTRTRLHAKGSRLHKYGDQTRGAAGPTGRPVAGPKLAPPVRLPSLQAGLSHDCGRRLGGTSNNCIGPLAAVNASSWRCHHGGNPRLSLPLSFSFAVSR